MTKVEIYYDFERTSPVTDYDVCSAGMPIATSVLVRWFVFGDTSVVARDTAIVWAYEKASVYASDNVCVRASDSSRVLAWERVKVYAYDNAKVDARDTAYVIAHDDATVWLSNYAKAEEYGNATVIASSIKYDRAAYKREVITLNKTLERLKIRSNKNDK